MITSAKAWSKLFGRRYRQAGDENREKIATAANGLTLARACIACAILSIAIVERSHMLLLIGLGVSLLLDVADGQLSRSGEGHETIAGAQLDGIADRLAALGVLAAAIVLRGDPLTVVAAVVVWVQFGVVDGFLAGQFLRFGLWSPDHFHAIDERVWRYNWSAAAKVVSNLPVPMLAVGSVGDWPALGLAAALIVIRVHSYRGIQFRGRLLPEEKHARRPAHERAEPAAEPAPVGPYVPEPVEEPVAARLGEPIPH